MARRKTHEEFVAEVKALVGEEYEVTSEYRGADESVMLRHVICGEAYNRKARSFLRNSTCKFCTYKKISKSHKEFVAEVDAISNSKYKVLSEYEGAGRKLKLKHIVCEHEFPMTPANFLKGKRCPLCAKTKRWDTRGRKSTSEYKKELEYTFGLEFSLLSEFVNTSTKVLIRHNNCGEKRWVYPSSIMKNGGCPRCKESKGEKAIANFLNLRSVEYIRQKPIKYSEKRLPLFLDFWVQGVAIEYDGEYHYKPMPHAGGEEGLLDQQRRDAIKTQYCADNGIPLIRIPYWDFDNIDAILTEKLLTLLTEKKVA